MTEEQIKAAFYAWFIAHVGQTVPDAVVDNAWESFRKVLYP